MSPKTRKASTLLISAGKPRSFVSLSYPRYRSTARFVHNLSIFSCLESQAEAFTDDPFRPNPHSRRSREWGHPGCHLSERLRDIGLLFTSITAALMRFPPPFLALYMSSSARRIISSKLMPQL